MSVMRKRSEVVVRELRKYNIEPTAISALGSGHIRIEWVYGGRTFYQVIPNSPSDVRGPLNERAETRRMLRSVGAKPPTKERPQTTFQKAISLPQPVDPLSVRVERLESEVDALLDMLSELREQFNNTTWRVEGVMTPIGRPAAPEQPQPVVEKRPPERPPGKKTPSTQQLSVLKLLSEDWTSYRTISQLTGRRRSTGSDLRQLKLKGLVENSREKLNCGSVRGYWKLSEAGVLAKNNT